MNKAKAKDKIYMGCRCYERLQPNTKEFTRLAYTELYAMGGRFFFLLRPPASGYGAKPDVGDRDCYI
jgi:hypothetical protein